MRDQSLQIMLWKITFRIEFVFAAVTFPLMFPHLHHCEPILFETSDLLLSCLIQIAHSNNSGFLFYCVLVDEMMFSLSNDLIRFIAVGTTLKITALKFIDCFGCPMITIDFELNFIFVIVEVWLNGYVDFTSAKSVTIQSIH